MAEHLWLAEALELAEAEGIARGVRSKARDAVWDRLAERLRLETIQAAARRALLKRAYVDKMGGRRSWKLKSKGQQGCPSDVSRGKLTDESARRRAWPASSKTPARGTHLMDPQGCPYRSSRAPPDRTCLRGRTTPGGSGGNPQRTHEHWRTRARRSSTPPLLARPATTRSRTL